MIVVTGGAGFIGSALVAQLNRRNTNDILIVDQLGTDSKWKNLRKLRYADYMESDDFLEMVLSGDMPFEIEAVFHLGACSSTTEPDCKYLIKNNFEYSKNIATWAVDADIRFIYASSAATYGDGTKGFSDDHETIDSLVPLNMYGYSKQLFDQWSMNTGLLEQIVGLKYFNVFGPNEYHKADMRSFILKSYQQIEDTGKVRLFKSYLPQYDHGQQQRDFLYVKDAVDMTLYFLDHPYLNGIYNIGTGSAHSWNQLVHAVFAAMGRKAEIEYIDMPDSIRGQYQYFTQADMTKLRTSGYTKPATPIEAAVLDYVHNYLIADDYLGAY